jgi:predicted DNA-binding transcriptional regulator
MVLEHGFLSLSIVELIWLGFFYAKKQSLRVLKMIHADINGYGIRVTSLSAEEANIDKIHCREYCYCTL